MTSTEIVPAVARVRAYLDALPNAANLGAEFAYGKQFRSEEWPHDSYPLTREDVETLLDELARAQAEAYQYRTALQGAARRAAVPPVDRAALRPMDRGATAEALLLRFTAEAHRRKWAYDRGLDDDGVPIKSEAFDALHRLGEEMRVELEKLRGMAAEAQPGTEAPAVTMHAIPLPGSNGISSCCGRPPCEFVGERVTRDPAKVTCPGPAAEAQQDGARS